MVVALAVLAAACSKDSPDNNAADRTTTTVESAGGPTTKPESGPTTTIPDSVRIEVVSSQPRNHAMVPASDSATGRPMPRLANQA